MKSIISGRGKISTLIKDRNMLVKRFGSVEDETKAKAAGEKVAKRLMPMNMFVTN